jgi:hypothetical protein
VSLRDSAPISRRSPGAARRSCSLGPRCCAAGIALECLRCRAGAFAAELRSGYVRGNSVTSVPVTPYTTSVDVNIRNVRTKAGILVEPRRSDGTGTLNDIRERNGHYDVSGPRPGALEMRGVANVGSKYDGIVRGRTDRDHLMMHRCDAVGFHASRVAKRPIKIRNEKRTKRIKRDITRRSWA